MIITALTETRKQSGKKFVTRVKNGNLELIEKLTQTVQWVIEEGVNLLDVKNRKFYLCIFYYASIYS